MLSEALNNCCPNLVDKARPVGDVVREAMDLAGRIPSSPTAGPDTPLFEVRPSQVIAVRAGD